VYRQGFQFLDMGYASALAWIAVLGIALFTIFYVRLMRRHGSI
jgi:multiple sugar transport system permease protein